MGHTLAQYATSWKVAGLIPDEVTGFFSSPNPFRCTVALVLTQPVIEMSNRNLPGGKELLACKVDKLTAICELIV
jgi:hypothetical protein